MVFPLENEQKIQIQNLEPIQDTDEIEEIKQVVKPKQVRKVFSSLNNLKDTRFPIIQQSLDHLLLPSTADLSDQKSA